ncbi:MAG: hypothetical protein H6647_07520 [Anaerolineales bacterium]|nr:hypothetical protein [Anaerolineales bacterium]
MRRQLGGQQMLLEMESLMVRPEQFLGIEVNPRAAAIAELVLWIGFLQWHFRSHGDVRPPEPIIHRAHNIECRDAVLAWGRGRAAAGRGRQPRDPLGRAHHQDASGDRPRSARRDRACASLSLHQPAAGRVASDRLRGRQPAVHRHRPYARRAGRGGYTEAIRKAYKTSPPRRTTSCFWWDKAALILARSGRIQRFGLITATACARPFNRRVIEHHLSATPPLSLLFAIP